MNKDIKRSVFFRACNRTVIERLAQRYGVIAFCTIARYPLSRASKYAWEIEIPVETQKKQLELYTSLLHWGKENLPGSLKDSFKCGTVNE